MEPLTPREAEIARLVARGRSYKGIATELGISIDTVKAHVRNAASRIPGRAPAKTKLILFVVQLRKSA